MEAVEEMTTILCPWRNAERDVLVCALNMHSLLSMAGIACVL